MEDNILCDSQPDFSKKLRLLFFSFFIYCVVGWVYELFWYLFEDGYLINRGFLYGPYLPVYGVGCTLIILLFTNIKNRKIMLGKINFMPIILFFVITITCTLVELVTAYICDFAFATRNPLWTYDKSFLNFDGKICLRASLIFGVCGTFFLYFVQPLINKIVDKIPDKVQNILFYTLTIGLIVDLCLSATFKLILR